MILQKQNYLNAFDYTAALLNYQCRRTPAHANPFMIAMECREKLKNTNITHLLHLLESKSSFFSGHMARNPLHAAPYWKPGNPVPFRISFESIGNSTDFLSCAENFGNKPFGQDSLFEIKIFEKSEESLIFFKFSHLLFDGRGGELLLKALDESDSTAIGKTVGMSSPQLWNWIEQFRCGRQVNRKLIANARSAHPAALQAQETALNKFKVIRLTGEETRMLSERSETTAGPFMMLPFLMYSVSKQMNKLLMRSEIPGDLMIQNSVDMRGQNQIPSDSIFFNHWSLMPFILHRKSLENKETALKELKDQFFQNTAERLPYAFWKAGLLGRIMPLAMLDALTEKFAGALSGTFMFSFLSETSLKEKRWAGHPLTGLYHMPTVPPRPGIGFFFSVFHGELTCVISYRQNIFPEADLIRLEHGLTHELKGLS